jgi:hypothetical protein
MNDSALDAPPMPRKKRPDRQWRGRLRCARICLPPKKFPERLKEAAWERCRFLGKTLQLLSEWHLLAG